MRALRVEPGKAGSTRLENIDEPVAGPGDLLVRTAGIGICGTDREIVAGRYGWPPEGRDRMILGHESVGRVERAPPGSAFAPGDLVVGIVRRPDPLPCRHCAAGEWDMCSNGRYTECGIKARDGFACDRFAIEPGFAVKVDLELGLLGVLLEPASIIAKAWDHVEHIGRRSATWAPRTLLVTGAGPVGLLAALAGAQRGLEVHMLDLAREGPKPALARDLGATYHQGRVDDGVRPDIVLECTGAANVILEAIGRTAAGGITCLAGLSSGQHRIDFDIQTFNRSMVLENDVVFGSVNANRAHYEQAAEILAAADRSWLSRLISRRVKPERWEDAFERQDGDIKVVLDFAT